MPKKKSESVLGKNISQNDNDLPNNSDISQTNININEEMFYLSLNHEIRRQIILYLGENEFAGFTDFKKITGVSIGTIYHHLDTIKDLIYQDKKKKYHLTKLGEQAYHALNQNSDSIQAVKFEESIHETKNNDVMRKKILDYLYLKKIYLFMENNPSISYIIPLLIIILNSILCYIFDVELYLLFALPVLKTSYPPLLADFFQILSVFVGYLILVLTSDFLSRMLFGKKADLKILLKYISLCYIPILCYLILYGILRYIPEFSQSFSNKIFVIIFQLWAILILSFILSTKIYLKFERAIIISVFINYASFLFVLLFKAQNLPFS